MTLSACSIIPKKKEPIYPNFDFVLPTNPTEYGELVECNPDEVSFMESVKSTVDTTEFFDSLGSLLDSYPAGLPIEAINDSYKVEFLREIPREKDFVGLLEGASCKYITLYKAQDNSVIALMYTEKRQLKKAYIFKQSSHLAEEFEMTDDFFEVSDVQALDPDGLFYIKVLDGNPHSVHLTVDGCIVFFLYSHDEAQDNYTIRMTIKLKV